MLKVLGKKCSMFVIMAVLVQSIFCTQVFANDVIEEEIPETEISASETEVNSLPIGWQSKDIGDVGLAGSATFTDSIKLADKFTLSGAGKGINGYNDSFQFTYQKLSGDFSIEAFPKIILSGDQKIKAGIMIRESLYSDSAFVGMFTTNDKEALIQSRKAWKKKVTTGYEKSRNLEAYSNSTFKLVRNGEKIVCFVDSIEGWKQIGEPIKIDAGKTVYAGLCVTSEDKNVLSQIDFANVGIQQKNSIYTKQYKSITAINEVNQVNLALGKTNVAAAHKEKSPAANAVDGKVNTVWSVDGAPHTFTLDLENTYSISSFETILTKQDALKYTIETSTDGLFYTLVVDKASNIKKAKNHNDNINSVVARYIKLTVLGINKESFPQINIGEFKVMGSSEPVLETMTSTISSTSFGTNPIVSNREVYEAINCTFYTVRRKDRALAFGSNSSFIKEFSTEGYSDITIEIDRWTENCEMDESFITEWFDGKTWEKIEEVKGNVWKYSDDVGRVFALPEAASDNKNCKIRIRTEKYDSDDMAFLDKVEIKGKYTKAPAAPKNLKSQIVTDNSAIIAWDESEDFLYGDYYDVYLDDGTRLGRAKDTRFLIGDLEKGKDYKVYVKAVNATGVSSEASDIISITTTDSDSIKTVYYEAEDGNLSGSVCVVEDSTCSGGKRVVKNRNIGWNGTLDININCEIAGNYILSVFYNSNDIEFQELRINGLSIDTQSNYLYYPNNSPEQRSFNVQLNAGDNVLSIYNPSFCNDNSIDRVAITPLQ